MYNFKHTGKNWDFVWRRRNNNRKSISEVPFDYFRYQFFWPRCQRKCSTCQPFHIQSIKGQHVDPRYNELQGWSLWFPRFGFSLWEQMRSFNFVLDFTSLLHYQRIPQVHWLCFWTQQTENFCLCFEEWSANCSDGCTFDLQWVSKTEVLSLIGNRFPVYSL